MYIAEPAINPSWVDFNHNAGCEDHKFFQCRDTHCTDLIPDTELNWCPACLVFIPRITECVCEQLDELWRE